jgi:cytochrome c
MRKTIVFLALALIATPASAQQDLRGHGGPVRALAIAPDGVRAISGSFDQSAILWALDRGRALAILRAHDGSVNAVLALPGGRFVTGGEDGRVVLWRTGEDKPLRVGKPHDAPVAALAASADGTLLASAAWDGEASIIETDSGREVRRLVAHKGNVNAIAFLPGGAVATASYDATARLWPADGSTPKTVEFDSPLNALAALPDGRFAVGAADGSVRVVSADGRETGKVEASQSPITALAASPDGRALAAASPRGSVALIDVASLRVTKTLTGPGLPVWSLAYAPDGRTLFTGGGDRLVRRWDARTGEHLGAVVAERPADDFAGLALSRQPAALRSIAPAPCATRCIPTTRIALARRSIASSAARLAQRRATTIRRRSGSWRSSGRARPCPDCSKSARRPTRPARRCPSRPLMTPRTAPR